MGSDGHVRVRITQTSACASCKVAAHCNASGQKVKTVDVFHCLQPDLKAGDSVTVFTSPSAAGRALTLGFGVPLLLLLAVLAAMLAAGTDEGASALTALAMLAIYYFIVWLCRDRVAKGIRFYIGKKSGNELVEQ